MKLTTKEILICLIPVFGILKSWALIDDDKLTNRKGKGKFLFYFTAVYHPLAFLILPGYILQLLGI